ncbi:MAG: TolC family protein [Odoribacter splanchnicus]|jgi:outer membrane protein TolC
MQGIPAELIRRRPDVRSAERTMDALAAAAGATRADWWPKFYLTGAFGYGNEYYKQFFKKENMTWQISPSIKWTIFSGRQIAQANRQAQIQLDEGINTYNQTLLTALQEVDDALSSYNKSLQQLDADRLALQEIKLTLEYAMDLYKKGLTNYQNVLDSQRNVLNYENVYVNSQSATLLYMIQVYKALGGGVEK